MTRRRQIDGCGIHQMRRARSRQTTTTACLFEIPLRILGGMYLIGHRDGGGEVQKVSDDESELLDEEAEECPEGRENIGADCVDGVAGNLRDLSVKGSLAGGVLENLSARRSKRLILKHKSLARPHHVNLDRDKKM